MAELVGAQVILGVVRGLPVQTLMPWAASARRVYPGRLVLLADPPSEYLEMERYGAEIFPADLKTESGTCDLCRIRWRETARFLGGVDDGEPVIVTDVRDVVFQANPFPDSFDKLWLASEYKPHKRCPWSTHWVQAVAPDEAAKLANEPVICAGVIGGPAHLVRRLAQTLYEKTPRVDCACAGGAAHMCDQAVLNVLLRNGLEADSHIMHGWCFHCMGWVPQGVRPGPPVTRSDGHPYPIVHQWDRVTELQSFKDIA